MRVTVDWTNRFPEITREIHELGHRAVVAGVEAGAATASGVGGQRHLTVEIEPAHETPSGWRASFVSPKGYAWYQNYGTLGNRTKPLKHAPRGNRTRAAGTGIKPLYYLDAGKRAGRRAMMAVIKGGLK